MAGVLGMAKAKGRGPGRPASASEPARETVINMKGSPEYVQWLDEAHKKTHIPKVQIFRLALQAWASKNGLSAPPEI
jgi:hypothetical protein